MDEKLIQEFIQWLPQNIEEFANKSPEEIITTINALSKSEDGVKMLQQLITTFQQSKSPNSFKLGGKIEAAVVKFQQGGLTRKQALANYMANNEGATRSQARQAYRNAKFVGKYNIGNNALKNDGYQNNRDWARQLISGQTTNSNEPKISVTPTNNLMTTVGLPQQAVGSIELQNGGKFDPYYGPLKVTDEGYFDVDGREVLYEEPRIKQWINARNERKRLENDALSEAGFGKGIQLDTFNNKPWESITRGVHQGGIYTPADTILIKHLDNGKLQRENAKSLKTFISRKLFGDSKFDQINREFENK